MTELILAGLLNLASLTHLYAACGSDVHPSTIQAIIEVESAGNPLAILDNETCKSYRPKDRNQAVKIAGDLLAQGHSLDMGLMQINSQHLKKKRIDYKELFDPCVNIRAGTKILADFYKFHEQKNPKEHPDIVLLKALSSYNTGKPYHGRKYVAKILKKARLAGNQTAIQPVWAARRQQIYFQHSAFRRPNNMAFFRKETL